VVCNKTDGTNFDKALGGGVNATTAHNVTITAPTDSAGAIITTGTPHGWSGATDNGALATVYVICAP